ncbi:hypothetical protein ACFPER_15990 [Agromyces aurantiacus]|uniref:Uncharacterized protein n=1 Tax=Agromyces aurantiacus TaxID=165814 RepID=A0ABV9RD89_9MICO|nr:hypothetical protein [Agromyces aurantiacus]MBM7504806.1 hypothetical protein [Agromyces aurantiacus]
MAVGRDAATSNFGDTVNAIIVLPFLMACAVGYLVLIIATILVVRTSIARRRDHEGGASRAQTSRWLDGVFVTLLTCSVAATSVIVLAFGYAPQPIGDTADAALVGTWVSASGDAPGELHLTEAGKATARDLTVPDQSAYWGTGVVEMAAEHLDAEGTWRLNHDNLHVSMSNDDHEIEWTLLVSRSAFGGLKLEAIVGDPDGPAFTQAFEMRSAEEPSSSH